MTGTPDGGELMIHGTLETIDGRPALRFERILPHSVERVWRAVSVPAELERWFPAAAEWTPAPGDTFEAAGATGEVTEVEPPHRLAWTYAGHLYSFDLSAHDDGCRLVFIHVVDEGMPLAQTATGWETYLLRLEPHLAGEHLSEEDAHKQWEEIHEQYAERFGVDPTPGREWAAAFRASQS
jgi:uncharacterized protein YndB with AHSA1/START domain